MTKSVLDMELKNKRVLVRVDFNVPMQDGKITSTIRVDEAMPTINYLRENGAKVILCSHLGRPDGKKVRKYSLKPVYEYLKTLLPENSVYYASDCVADKTKEKAKNLKAGEVLLLENLRYYSEEEANDPNFAKKLASLGQIYVNDAFGTAHRKHASTYGVAEYIPSCCGLLIKKELDAFAKIDTPQRPFVAILGGAKLIDKLAVTQNLLNKVDTLLIGGGMAYTFLKAQGKNIGKSILSEEQIEFCKSVLKTAQEKGVKIVLPVDVVCAKNMKDTNTIKTYNINKIPDDMAGFDIGKKTVKLFNKYIKKAKTVVWNGPLGVYEMEEYSKGTKEVAINLSKNKDCFSIIGGGDVVSAVEKYNLKDKISHVSTGGGASLKLIEGSTLAGVSVLGKEIKKEKPKKTTTKKKETKVSPKKEVKKAETKKSAPKNAEPKKSEPKLAKQKISKTTTNLEAKKVNKKSQKKQVVKVEPKPKTTKTKKTTATKTTNEKATKTNAKIVAKTTTKKANTIKATTKTATKKNNIKKY